MGKNRELKEAKVLEIKGKMEKAKSIVISKYQGLTVEEDTTLRRNLREAGVEYKVYKNTLGTLAAKELGYEGLNDLLEGPVSIAFGYEDPTAPARILNEFAEDHKKLELKGGIVQGEFFDKDKIIQLAKIPPKEVLIAKLLGSFKAPLSKVVYLLNAIKEQKESQEA
ncbi:50S ribosomal protein L10 [Clostridium fermenticellae]|uniref:Large ribosomal subunit protein uL10 n=1 Tax=Clostridium fermenticellae TaxID=2068654 RepID=A0A386H109_9CLOT|nr:50S ribosomal protein L10 [Clostridium fermenticellae]AYD39243.1 50S ribosomal protein L10 [Clostridium fermenticellae]